MELIADPWFWAIGIFAVFLTGISKGGVGGGAGGVSTPLLSLVISPVAAAAIMLPVLCLLDIFGIRAYLWKWDAAVTRRIVAGGLIGTVGGALTISWLDDNWIRIMIGVIALGFLAVSYLPRRNVAKPSNRAGWLLSALSGYATFITHAGGPPVIVLGYGVWQKLGLFDYDPHWQLIAATVGLSLVGIVTFGSLAGSMLPFILRRVGFDPASASAPLVATMVDVGGLVIYFTVALLVLGGTLL